MTEQQASNDEQVRVGVSTVFIHNCYEEYTENYYATYSLFAFWCAFVVEANIIVFVTIDVYTKVKEDCVITIYF